jgi:signal transduction histidine kinase
VEPEDSRRRKRRIFLLLSAILIPTAVVILLVVRLIHQETELSERRMVEERRESLDQLRRELSARLQAIRVEQVNRLIGDSGSQLPADSPIVFVAPFEQDRMVLPWEENRTATPPTVRVLQYLAQGESLEFRTNDPAAAATAYKHALEVARTQGEKCEARLRLGRAYIKAGMSQDAGRTDHIMLQECDAVADNDGVSLSLYAAQRLLAPSRDRQGDSDTANYLIQKASIRRWRQPNEAYMLRSLLNTMSGPAAGESLLKLSSEIHEMEQITALAQNIHDYLGELQRAFRSAPGDLSWIGYGAEPWLITMVSPASFAAPVIIAVSSKKVVPEGMTLHARHVPDAMPLGDGFVDLEVKWPADYFASPPGIPLFLYASTLLLALGATLLAAHLLLRDLHREAQTAEMRSHFVASVSHELKTPLTAIQAVTETLLLDRAGRGEETREYLKTILSESARLSRLVENVLDFSRIEQGRKIYRMQSTCLVEVVRSATKAMEYPLSQLGFTLTISTDGTAPTLHADPDALKQALLNLIGNAMKYSGEARNIEIRTGSRDDEAFVDVVDHGIGISREDQKRIFEKFHRVRSTETEGVAGTGLGLALALHIVEAHKGRIEVSSEVGGGSTFSVRIPQQAPA